MATTYGDAYLKTHQQQISPQQTADEGNRFVEAFALTAGSQILDVGCGHGRHAFYLAQRGFTITGVDISKDLLAHGIERLAHEPAAVNFVHGDMRKLPFEAKSFDGVLIAYSSWGFFSEAENAKILRGIWRILKPGGVFVLDYGNSEHHIKNFLKDGVWDKEARVWRREFDEALPNGDTVHRRTQLDPTTMRYSWHYDYSSQDGTIATSTGEQTSYSLLTLTQLLAAAGFQLEKAWDNYTDDQPATRCILRAVRPLITL